MLDNCCQIFLKTFTKACVGYYATEVPALQRMRQDCVSISRVLNVDRLAPLSKLTPNVMSQLLCFIEDDNSSHLIITLHSGFDPYSLSSLAAPVARLYDHLNVFIKNV